MASNNSSLPAVAMADVMNKSGDTDHIIKLHQAVLRLGPEELELFGAAQDQIRADVEKHSRNQLAWQLAEVGSRLPREVASTMLREVCETHEERRAKQAARDQMIKEKNAAEKKAKREAAEAKKAALLPAKVGDPMSPKGPSAPLAPVAPPVAPPAAPSALPPPPPPSAPRPNPAKRPAEEPSDGPRDGKKRRNKACPDEGESWEDWDRRKGANTPSGFAQPRGRYGDRGY